MKLKGVKHFIVQDMSHPSRGGWIEITFAVMPPPLVWSHPSRGGWIEIIF